ncbi:nicotinate phosphoribosyltransferase [Antarcticibacterium sp. 1MA-6-2]|uniref:nicotinate phosphoribosyltransferase n=1 Tax=Antarcticibacterium sp. 1MA-6-2 TaxID=2908210 RepID=UPI001F22B5FA|nr:nicotinate phosphoribosyltransferase [Antarcticibacterium sp. 1MA-6-2]UJH90329.1 nicotinate phosphoribosyltransferase [Antarcticibacterium sp. 1MA-6-2]
MINFSATYTDQYQLAMAEVYFKNGHKEHTAVFDYYFRKVPFSGAYAIFAGLEDLLRILENLRFSEDDIRYLQGQGFDSDFLDYLKDFRFNGRIFSALEGDLVFPNRPILQVEANIIEAQIIETLLLNLLNFQTLVATKASRMRLVAGERKLLEFGMRRAQATGSYHASRAAIIGGFNGTSNVMAAKNFDIPVSGTMAHSFIQSFDDELEAFRAFAKGRPKGCVLLVDTYNTLESGLPHAIKVGKEMEARGEKLAGIRLDSGDLAYLARESRKMLDNAGLSYVKIAASNQLDEYVIKSLLEQQAPIDIFGVGTSLVTGSPDAAIDGVYKLSMSNGKPRIKISENLAKVTIPHKKQVFRIKNSKGELIGADAIALREETRLERMYDPVGPLKSLPLTHHDFEPLLHPVMENGKTTIEFRSVWEIAEYSAKRLSALLTEYKRFDNPHIYKIGISRKLKKERADLLSKYKEMENEDISNY